MTAVINAERRFCRSKIMSQHYFAGVTLNKSNTVIMGVHNGELQIVMERQITYKRVMMESSLSLLFLFFYSLKMVRITHIHVKRILKIILVLVPAIAKLTIMHSPIK